MTMRTIENEIYQLISPKIIDKIASMVLLMPDQLDINHPLTQYGFDSIKATELLAFIEDTFSIDIEPQDIPDLLSTEDILQYLSTRLADESKVP